MDEKVALGPYVLERLLSISQHPVFVVSKRNSRFVLKLFSLSKPQRVERLLDILETLRAHPNIIQVVDHFETESGYAVVFPYYAGRSGLIPIREPHVYSYFRQLLQVV